VPGSEQPLERSCLRQESGGLTISIPHLGTTYTQSTMTSPLESAHAHLQKAAQHLELSKVHYESAKATYQSAKTICEAIEASHLNLASRSSFTFLCDSCATISIQNIFNTALTTKAHRRKVGDLFQAVDGQSSCVLCKFLIEAFQLGDPEHSEQLHAHLKPRDTAIYFTSDPEGRPWFRKAGVDTNLSSCPFVWLQTGPPTRTGEPHICISFEPRAGVDAKPRSLEQTTYPRRRDPLEAFNGSINYDLVTSWFKKCDTQHGGACNGEKSLPVQNIFLIDVKRRRVVSGQKHYRYVALSYVWGKGPDAQFSWFFSRGELQTTMSAGSQICTDLPSLVPQTMEDAITFVKSIGEKYLWIDLFCIDQSNKEQKQNQINSMDRIYACAYLTLVCLDGQDADWGLPGVSRPLQQTSQPTVALGAGRLTATYIYSV
jgi:Heterokaryon incompatibility protein (HET)